MTVPRVRYVSPSSSAIEHFVKVICDALAVSHDPKFADPVVVRGLADFLKLVARIEAKRLNHAAGVDSDSE